MRRTCKFNPKRRLMADQPQLMERLRELAAEARYGGNPEHKRNPGDFGLIPPCDPRRGKTLCDDCGVFRKADALNLLRQGLSRGLVDGRWSGDGWPQLVWAVTSDGVPLEAQREADGVYHGYPLLMADPFAAVVLQRWQALHA
jgi:hypothetical protein